jgi:hypothetical protein
MDERELIRQEILQQLSKGAPTGGAKKKSKSKNLAFKTSGATHNPYLQYRHVHHSSKGYRKEAKSHASQHGGAMAHGMLHDIPEEEEFDYVGGIYAHGRKKAKKPAKKSGVKITRQHLIDILKSYGFRGYSKMRKAELQAAVHKMERASHGHGAVYTYGS